MTSFLEIGCGTGFVVTRIGAEFPAAHVCASELFPEAMEYVSRRVPRAELYQVDARALPFRDEFAVIGAFDVIEHIDDDVRALAEIHDPLVPNGVLVLTVPHHPFLWSYSDEFAHHKRRYTRKVLAERLHQVGYRLVAMRPFVSLLMPLLLASRLRSRQVASPDPRAEFRIPKPLNRFLSGVMSAERALIAAGVRFPFGGSLLAVARRAG